MSELATKDEINDYLLFELPQFDESDYLLLGSKSASGTIAREVAEDFEQGKVKNIYISGGEPVSQRHVGLAIRIAQFTGWINESDEPWSDFTSPEKEAINMARILLESGVPADKIKLVETDSTNTGANFENTFDVIKEIDHLTIVTLSYHQRRALGTALRVFRERGVTPLPFKPGVKPPPSMTTKAIYPFGITRDNWHKTPLRWHMFQEAKKCDQYRPDEYCDLLNPNAYMHAPNMTIIERDLLNAGAKFENDNGSDGPIFT